MKKYIFSPKTEADFKKSVATATKAVIKEREEAGSLSIIHGLLMILCGLFIAFVLGA